MRAAAMYRCHGVPLYATLKFARNSVNVKFSGVDRMISGPRKSFQKKTKAKTATAARAGLERGRMIRIKMCHRDAPSR